MKTMLGYVLIAFLGLMFLSSAPANLASTKEPRKEPPPPQADEGQGEKLLEFQSTLKINKPSMYALPSVSVKQEQSSVMEELEALDRKCHKIEALLRRRVK